MNGTKANQKIAIQNAHDRLIRDGSSVLTRNHDWIDAEGCCDSQARRHMQNQAQKEISASQFYRRTPNRWSMRYNLNEAEKLDKDRKKRPALQSSDGLCL